MSALENEPTRLPALLRATAQTLNIEDPADLPQPKVLLGITGAPGSGKSTLTDALITAYRRRHPDKRIGVIAVDPSSPFTGGAVLGDRVRMMRHATDPMVFVRSMASRGHLGGLSLGVKGVIRAMGLIGCELVIVETVGVGQSEVEIAQVADNVLVVLAPGQGDSVQLLKAGLMEIGDWFIVNKADREGAAQLYSQLTSALHMHLVSGRGHHAAAPAKTSKQGEAPAGSDDNHQADAPSTRASTGRTNATAGDSESKMTLTQYACSNEGATHDGNAEALTDLALQAGDDAQVYLVTASDGTGVDELLDGLEKRIERDSATWQQHRRQRVRDEIAEAILETARGRLASTMHQDTWLSQQVQRVMKEDLSIDTLAQQLLARTAGSESTQSPTGDSNPNGAHGQLTESTPTAQEE